jgi:hypothetical protein
VIITPSNLPIEIMNHYWNVNLCGDIIFVNKIPFFVTISRHIHFGTLEMIANRQMATIFQSIPSVVKIYKQQGFKVTHILLDREFKPLRGDLAALEIQLNLVLHAEYVSEVERYIRTLKDRTRCIYNTLPFKHMSSCIIIEMVQTSNFGLMPSHTLVSLRPLVPEPL